MTKRTQKQTSKTQHINQHITKKGNMRFDVNNNARQDLKDEFSLDSLDEVILRRLKENARIPFSTIAHELRVTEGTVRARVKRLMKRGHLLGFTTKVRSDEHSIILVSFVNGLDSDVLLHVPSKKAIEGEYHVFNGYDVAYVVQGKESALHIFNYFKSHVSVSALDMYIMKRAD